MYSNLVIYIVDHELLPLIVFSGILLAVRLGRWLGNRAHHKSQGTRITSDDTLIGAILGLMGLLIAFSFSGATTRFENRTHEIVAEANAVAAAYDSASLLPALEQPALQASFRSYLMQRLDLYKEMPDFQRYDAKRLALETTQFEINAMVQAAYKQANSDVRPLAADAIRRVGGMSSAYVTQQQAMLFHQPHIIWFSLLCLVLIGAFLSGYKMGLSQRKEPFLTTMFGVLMAGAIYVTIIIEFPMLGKISLDQYNQVFENILSRIPLK